MFLWDKRCILNGFEGPAPGRLSSRTRAGIQIVTTVLGVSCVTLLNNTKQPVTIKHETNMLAGTSKDKIVR